MKRNIWKVVVGCGLAAAIGAIPATAGTVHARLVAAGGAGSVNLPYVVPDNMGNQWRIYQYGQLQQTGNMPLYSQGAMLHINGNQPQMQGRAHMDQWISVEASNFTPHAMKFIYEHVFKRPQDPAAVEAAGKGLTTALGVMEQRLAEGQYLAGSQLTLADVMFMPYFEYGMMTPAKDIIAKFPAVSAWWNRVGERPTWRKVVGRA